MRFRVEGVGQRVEGGLDLFRHVDFDADHVPSPVPSEAALPNVNISEPDFFFMKPKL